MSIWARLVLVVLIALVPALGFQAYSESEARRIRLQLVEDEALRLVRLISGEQQRIIDGAEQALYVLSVAPLLQDSQPQLCEGLLDNVVRQTPRYTLALVIGLDGHPVCASGPMDRSTDLSDRWYFRNALQTGGTVVGEFAIGRRTGRPTVHLARPFRNRDGVVAGVVALALDIDWLGQQLAHLPLPQDAAASIADRNGTILARTPNGAQFVGRSIPAEDRYSLQGDAIQVAQMTSLDGRQRIAAYSPPGADPKGLRVWVGLDRDITFAAMTRANRTGLLLIIAGGTLALLLTALLGSHLIRRPVARLLDAADRWRSGDLAARSGVRADGSEFGRLAGAFDGMAAALESRERALRTTLESTTDSVIAIDRNWRITYLSERARAHVAQGRDVAGMVLWEAFPGTENSAFAAGYREAMASGVPTHTVAYSAAFNTWFEAHAYPSNDGITAFFRDVTEERRIAAALRRSEELFGATFEHAAVGMAQVGLDGAWLRVNQRLCEIAGYTREEMLAGRFQDITHPDDLAADLEQMKALLSGEIAVQKVEKRYLRRDGSVGWVNITASLLRDATGAPERIIVVIVDITERRRIGAALAESEARFRLFIERAPAGIAMFDTDMRYLAASRRFARDYRVGDGHPENLLGRTHYEVFPDLPERLRSVHRRVLAGETLGGDEERFVQKDGRTDWVRWEMTPWRHADGTIGGAMLFAEIVTGRKEVELALRRSEQLFRANFEQLAVGMGIANLNNAWTRVNDKLCAITGYSREEMVGCSAVNITHPDDVEATRTQIEALVAGAIDIHSIEKRYLHKDGNVVWVHVTVSLLRDPDGRSESLIGVVEDITERKHAEAELRRLTATLEARVDEEVAAREAAQRRAAHAERLHALGQLAGGIAHDFNNVLQAVAGAATLIEHLAEDADRVRRLAQLAIEATTRGASITGRLLAFGRRADLHAESLDAAGLLHDLREMLAPTLGAAIDVQVRLAPDLPPLLADKGRLETVLVNLATNARDAMPQGGRLILSASSEVVSRGGAGHQAGLTPGRYVRLSVADTGIGMSADTLARASEPFFTTKPVGAGTGLGLSMAKGFAGQSGGELAIESSPGKGTTVTLWLPEADSASRPGAAAEQEAETAAVSTAPAAVMLVDDDDLVRESTAAYLANEGFRVLLAANGTEALALFDSAGTVDALVTDLAMPGMDGVTLIRTLQQRRPQLPALLLTGYAREETALAIDGAVSGAFSLLRKPVRGRELVGRIRSLLVERNGSDQ
jgi:PAS domain S-box-containing protein